MRANQRTITPAWYHGSREEFLAASSETIANQLAGRAADESLMIEPSQNQEWQKSIEILQKNLEAGIPMLRKALLSPGGDCIHSVVLEFDFRRRGLRMDCLLFADGVLFIIEFKRSKVERSDRDQVMRYAVNLLEFHRVTQDLATRQDGLIVVPVVALTTKHHSASISWPGFDEVAWPVMARKPLECDQTSLNAAILIGIEHRKGTVQIPLHTWLQSTFRPSSSILDATLSLYGNHDVAAIQDHAAAQESIVESTREIEEHIDHALRSCTYHVIFLSGSPGAGKTLVGLDLVMRGKYASESVFVTGNAPLVEVLNRALGKSYQSQSNHASWSQTGYPRANARLVGGMANYKVVKAHQFLGRRGTHHNQEDGRVLVFDEAQRTYKKGRQVMGRALEDHEADLILEVQRNAFPTGGTVIIALIGHNQAINTGEIGIVAWLEAIERKGWSFSIANETLSLAEFEERERWAAHPRRRVLDKGHLEQSMRYYRNDAFEKWVDLVLKNDQRKARELASNMAGEGDVILITRSLRHARKWARSYTSGGERVGLIASGQAKRLAAEGLFVEYKPDIADWMLAPSTDIRSSNALETVQNQYQIQGLELDYCVVCWDADLRREGDQWVAYKMSGTDWKADKQIDIAKNGYRVLLTRSRKGMVVFVPLGDSFHEDITRIPGFYDATFEFLRRCGATELGETTKEYGEPVVN